MNEVVEQKIRCPFCGEPITVLIDLSAGDQAYIEDCEVCCRPMEIACAVDTCGTAEVTAGRAG